MRAIFLSAVLCLMSMVVQATLPLDIQKQPSLAPMLKNTLPAVVNIATEGVVQVEQNPLMNDPFFRFFFDAPSQPRSRKTQSLGSGVIIDAQKGYIITNAHVIKSAKTIRVTLNDGKVYEAQLIGSDPASDVAVLQIKAPDLKSLSLSNSDTLEVGDFVVAIGNPFGLGQTVTSGIVSALGRTGLGIEGYEDFIQTDASINPGNSGGPLFNLAGEVVGINAQILSRTGGYMGVSFAIPIDMAMNVVEQLKTNGKVSRGFLGISFQSVTRELASSFGLDRPRGALVASVVSDSPAAKAGFKEGDIVLSFNGHEINEASQLPPLVGQTKIGEQVKVGVFRQKRIKTLEVTIAELPEEEMVAAVTGKKIDNLLQVEVRVLRDDEKKQHDVDHGVLITRVLKGPAQKAGIKSGDVLLSLNQKNLGSIDDFARAVEDLNQGKIVSALVSRGQEGKRYLAIKIDK